RAELEDTMAMTLGGRAAEEIVFGEITTGASNDIEKVTQTAKQMVMRFGMSDKLRPRVFGHDHSQPFLRRELSTEPDYADEGARDQGRGAHHDRGPGAAGAQQPHTSPGLADEDLRDPRQAGDDREGGVPRPARRQGRGRGVGHGGAGQARAAIPARRARARRAR